MASQPWPRNSSHGCPVTRSQLGLASITSPSGPVTQMIWALIRMRLR